MAEIRIDSHRVGPGHPAFLIAEVAQGHDGSLGAAHAYVDAVAEAGFDAVKFQTHLADHESTLDEPFRVRFTRQDATRLAYWRRMEFTEAQWAGLAAHARERGLVFLSSAFSLAAVKLLSRIGMPAWKVGSGEFRSQELIEAMAHTGAPVLFSTGMATVAEIDQAVAWFTEHGVPFMLFQCTSRYPTPLEQVGLNVLDDFGARYGCPVGLSDHSGSPFPALAALARGAHAVEVHVTFHRRMFGPDVPASLTVEELATLSGARDACHVMACHPVDKDKMAAELSDVRRIFTKSVALARSLPAGTVLDESMLAPKKPGTGIPFEERERVIGRALTKDVGADRLLRWEDIDVE